MEISWSVDARTVSFIFQPSLDLIQLSMWSNMSVVIKQVYHSTVSLAAWRQSIRVCSVANRPSLAISIHIWMLKNLTSVMNYLICKNYCRYVSIIKLTWIELNFPIMYLVYIWYLNRVTTDKHLISKRL